MNELPPIERMQRIARARQHALAAICGAFVLLALLVLLLVD